MRALHLDAQSSKVTFSFTATELPVHRCPFPTNVQSKEKAMCKIELYVY